MSLILTQVIRRRREGNMEKIACFHTTPAFDFSAKPMDRSVLPALFGTKAVRTQG